MRSYSGGGRELSSTYESLLASMEAMPLPERTAEEVARIDKAKAVLWDPEGYETPMYERYLANAEEYATAQGDYVIESQRLLGDPKTADVAPLMLRSAKASVDRAYKKYRTQDAEAIEAALAAVESLGVPLEQGMIAKARERFEAWNLPLANISDKMPFTYVSPSEWSNSEIDDIGWTTIELTESDLRTRHAESGYTVNSGSWSNRAVNGDVKVDVNIMGLYGLGTKYVHNGSSSGSSGDQDGRNREIDTSKIKNMTIKLQYGLCKIERPWLNHALFSMQNYYLRGRKAGSISDGTISGQIGDETPLLPAITTHFIVVRDVEIYASEWGSIRTELERTWGEQDAGNSQSHTEFSARAKGLFKFLSAKGRGKRTEDRSSGWYRTESGRRYSSSYGAHFKGNKLIIQGSQIVAHLSEVVRYAPPLDDPALSRPKTLTPPVEEPSSDPSGPEVTPVESVDEVPAEETSFEEVPAEDAGDLEFSVGPAAVGSI